MLRIDYIRACACLTLACALTFTGNAAQADFKLPAQLRATLATLDPVIGTTPTSEQLSGKPVIVSFFASWCPPCREEFAHLNHLLDHFDTSSFNVVAINVYEEFDENDAARMQSFLASTKPRFHVVKGNAQIIKAFANVQRIPTVFVFDAAGNTLLHFIHKVGATKRNPERQELVKALSAALARS